MAKLWSVKFKSVDGPVQACACTAFGAVANARNYSKLATGNHNNENKEEKK